jgi:hypothetical protein
MSTNAHHGRSRRTALRLRAIRERITGLQDRARRAATLALATAGLALAPTLVQAQMGQTAMTPAGGLVNRAVAGFQGLNDNGPGVLYYGLNAADRGLGYVGSYMTLGGFVPMAEDDLGGFWSADLRSHLSVYGGFFSNIGAVRKQFIGGTLLGVGVYWDYDGDQNQYSDTVIPTVGAPVVFAGGQTYNQIGISGEWLTDYGNLRSNGYIPVGTTADLLGPFAGNSILCVNGVNAALGGTDLEVGAYIPGLADWAGMISVGGYAYGNTRYQFPGGQGAVPWFGGVYTRLDMTFVENWDFSLQYNNDSYFDSTGFARLTYRMGGSRRRNVSDQVEQPMMRNEHIVRAHQAPEVALNPNNLDPVTGQPLAWRVFHVDNSAATAGDGTVDSPFTTIQAAGLAANAPYDIIYVDVGQSQTAPYVTAPGGFAFSNVNQYLIGEGATFTIDTVACGPKTLFADTSGLYPVITNTLGTAIVVNQPGSVVNHFEIRNSALGIGDGGGIAAPGSASVSDVRIIGNGGAAQRGIEIANSTGQFDFDRVLLQDLRNNGAVVSAANGRVSFTNSEFRDTGSTALLVSGSNARVEVTGSTIRDTDSVPASGGPIPILQAVAITGQNARVEMTDSSIQGVSGDAVVASGENARFDGLRTRILDTTDSAVVASGTGSVATVTNSTIARTGNPAIQVSGNTAGVYVRDSIVTDVTGAGVSVTGQNSVFSMERSRLLRVSGNGIEAGFGVAPVIANSIFVSVSDRSRISGIEGDGISAVRAAVRLADSQISDFGGAGIRALEVRGPATNPQLVAAGVTENAVWVQGATITNSQRVQSTVAGGIVVENSNLRVERLDAADPRSQATAISSTGPFGIRATLLPGDSGTMDVLVDSARIQGVNIGIEVAANAGPTIPNPTPPPILQVPTNIINFTATNNRITTNANGTGIALSGVFDTGLEPPLPGTALSRVNANIRDNQIGGGGGRIPILLTTVGGPTQDDLGIFGFEYATPDQQPLWIQAGGQVPLQNLNNGAAVTEVPAPVPANGILTSVNYNPGIVVPPPPAAPPATVPTPPPAP